MQKLASALLLACMALPGSTAAPLADLEAVTRKYLVNAPAIVRDVHAAPHSLPSSACPFIFFHLRKSAGSMVRQFLRGTARKQRLTTFIPCLGLSCQTYRLPSTKLRPTPAVIGGHFFYTNVEATLRRMANAAKPSLHASKHNFSCLTILREPVSRVESCWNYRLQRYGVAKVFSALTAEDVKQYLPTALDSFGSGCNNEVIRIFSGMLACPYIAAFQLTGMLFAAECLRARTNFAPIELTLAPTAFIADMGEAEQRVNTATEAAAEGPFMLESGLRNMATCVVGVLERCSETADVMEAAFPWLPRLPCATRANVYSDNVQKATNRAYASGVEREVLRQNDLESRVYRVANALLDAHLELIHSRRRLRSNATHPGRAGATANSHQ